FAQDITIAVFDLENNGLKDSEIRILTERLQSELVKVGGYTVVERKKIEKIFEEQKFQMNGCVEECLIEIGMLLGAKEIVIGSAGRFGSTYTISARLVNATSGEMIRSSDFDSEGDISTLLKSGMFRVASELTGRVLPPQLTGKRVNNNRGKGTLYIASYPSSADVWVDGYKVEGKTPITIPDLDEGTHTLKLVKDNYEVTKKVNVKSDEINKVDVVLQLSKENLDVFSTPSGAFVSIDGRSQRDLTPITVKGLTVGQHEVIITMDGYGPHKTIINVGRDKSNRYSVNLSKLANLTVTGRNIIDSHIHINGTEITGVEKFNKWGHPSYSTSLPKGNYLLKVSKDGYVPHEENFSLKPEEDKSIKINLVLLTGSIIVGDTYPAGTVVKLYNKSDSKGWTEHSSGNTSDNIIWKVTPHEYQLTISCVGYIILKKDIEIIGNDKITISDPLESNEWVLKEIISLKMKRNVSFVLGGIIAGTGGLLRSIADKQYNDYQIAGSNADELRDKVGTTDSLPPVFFGVGGVSLGLPLYYHFKIGKLKQRLAE
ncbi:MAG: PEGA domain-containing protein, partial [Candidatus Marinimicrobia bacterium]|nr:PEGA domain-containing protein [Candidatus Neomarinimicrobiota bacterium]